MKIAVDVDEVLVPLSECFFKHYNEKHGTSINIEDFSHYRYDRHLGLSVKKTFEEVHEYYKTEEFRNMPIIPDAKQVLAKLNEKYKLVVITSRYGPAKEFTKQWIPKEFPGIFTNIHFSAEKHYDEEYKQAKQIKEKSHICFDNKVDLIIDDSLSHALECAQKGIKVFLFNRQWNQGEIPANITRVNSWKEILEKINSLNISFHSKSANLI